MKRTVTKDIFEQNLYDYGRLVLAAHPDETVASLEICGGAYQLPLFVEIGKQAAFTILNNASINTHDEMRRILIGLGAR